MAGPRPARYAAQVIRTVLLASVLLPAAALAQVSVNSGALDQLKPSAPAHTTSAHTAPAASSQAATADKATTAGKASAAKRPASHRTTTPERPARTSTPPHTDAAPPKPKPKPRPVTIAPAPPPAAVLPPPVEAPKPASAPPPPPPVPVVPDAEGEFTPIEGGVRITFGSGKSDLNPVTVNALRAVAGQVKSDPAIDLNLFAYAAGVQDDPSTSRRLSLSRALAARAVLISEGIASTRIYVRALGATPSDGPPDRVDLVRAGTPPPSPKP